MERLNAGWLQVTSSRVAPPEAPLSFQRVRRALRARTTRQVILANATPGADISGSRGYVEPYDFCQIPPDLVVKTQVLDIAKVIL